MARRRSWLRRYPYTALLLVMLCVPIGGLIGIQLGRVLLAYDRSAWPLAAFLVWAIAVMVVAALVDKEHRT